MKAVAIFALLSLSIILPNVSAISSSESVEVNDKTYDVNYDATGLIVDGMQADVSTGTLSVFVSDVTESATIKITLDRSFFDSKTGENDEDFLVLSGVEDIVFTEEKNDSNRVLTIAIPSDTSSIDIISTGSTNFVQSESPVIEEPAETPEEPPEIPTEPVEGPQTTDEPSESGSTTKCGAGTILQDNACVLVEPIEEPTKETSIEEQTQEQPEQSHQCGPGTVLKDGVCALDETCGAGTILVDGQCVLTDSAPAPSTKAQGTQLIMAIVAAFVIAFVIMIILWAIGKAGRQKS